MGVPGRAAGKKAFVTGGAQGLGVAMARMLARHGARVAIADLNLEGGEIIAADINSECGAGIAHAYRLDVTNAASWTSTIDAAARAMGGLSVLVNNAGVAPIGTVEDLNLDSWHRTMTINVDGTLLGTRAALGTMRESQPGSIVNISSFAGLIASPDNIAHAVLYLASDESRMMTGAELKLDRGISAM